MLHVPPFRWLPSIKPSKNCYFSSLHFSGSVLGLPACQFYLNLMIDGPGPRKFKQKQIHIEKGKKLHEVQEGRVMSVISTFPMHWPTQGQWWSNRSTQLSHMEQWEHRGGRYSMHVSQYLTLTGMPFTMTSLVRGNCRLGVGLPPASTEAEDS